MTNLYSLLLALLLVVEAAGLYLLLVPYVVLWDEAGFKTSARVFTNAWSFEDTALMLLAPIVLPFMALTSVVWWYRDGASPRAVTLLTVSAECEELGLHEAAELLEREALG